MARGALRLTLIPRSGETRRAGISRSGCMGKHGSDDLVDYLLGVTLLAIVLIVGLAVIGTQLANVLHHA